MRKLRDDITPFLEWEIGTAMLQQLAAVASERSREWFDMLQQYCHSDTMRELCIKKATNYQIISEFIYLHARQNAGIYYWHEEEAEAEAIEP